MVADECFAPEVGGVTTASDPQPVRNIRSGGDDDNFAHVSSGLRQADSRGYPHQCVSFVKAFATMYSSSDEEEALLFLALEDEENSRFVFLSDGNGIRNALWVKTRRRSRTEEVENLKDGITELHITTTAPHVSSYVLVPRLCSLLKVFLLTTEQTIENIYLYSYYICLTFPGYISHYDPDRNVLSCAVYLVF